MQGRTTAKLCCSTPLQYVHCHMPPLQDEITPFHRWGDREGCSHLPRPHTWAMGSSRAPSAYSSLCHCAAPHSEQSSANEPTAVHQNYGTEITQFDEQFFKSSTSTAEAWLKKRGGIKYQIPHLSVIYFIFFRKVGYFNQSLVLHTRFFNYT